MNKPYRVVSRVARLITPIAFVVTVTDCATKRVAEEALTPGIPHDVFGDVLRFTLTYNRLGAMGISFGEWSKPVLIVCTIAVLFVLGRWYSRLQEKPLWTCVGLALVVGGALGNLGDRLFAYKGVVDFIDVGIGQRRFWIFNVADVAVTIGACLLAIAGMRRELTRDFRIPRRA